MDTRIQTEPNPPEPAPEKKKTLFDAVLTSTPVLLTVVATFMVGRSTAEMTQAQYYRAVAGQNQSKVGDQWGFFQAKRIRGTSYEVNADNFMAKEEPVRLTRETLAEAVKELADKAGKDEKNVAEAAERLRNCLDKGFTAGKYSYKPEQIGTAFATVSEFVVDKLPVPIGEDRKPEKKADENKPEEKKQAPLATITIGEDQRKLLDEAIKAINDRKPEKEIAPIVLKITDETLHDEIEKADAEAKKTAKKGKDAEYVMEQLDELMKNLARATYSYLQSFDKQPRKDDADRKQAEQQSAAVRSLIHKLMTNYTATRHTFTHRRYEKDARSNQSSAELYEVKVYHSGAKSDRHMDRSKNFMYAMLVAQVGVIIASMALAVKHKSLVWLLATVAGLVAIGFGGYVYLGMN
jgi:Domain of unknown function (DUF4337)